MSQHQKISYLGGMVDKVIMNHLILTMCQRTIVNFFRGKESFRQRVKSLKRAVLCVCSWRLDRVQKMSILPMKNSFGIQHFVCLLTTDCPTTPHSTLVELCRTIDLKMYLKNCLLLLLSDPSFYRTTNIG